MCFRTGPNLAATGRLVGVPGEGHVERVVTNRQSHPLGARRTVKVPDKVSDKKAVFVILAGWP